MKALLTEQKEGKTVLRKDVLVQDGQVWVTPAEVQRLASYRDPASGQMRLWAEGIAPRVAVDRQASRSQVYGAGRVQFAPGCGLYFLADYGGDGWRPRVERGLYALGDSGVGGERSVGHGQFDLEIGGNFPGLGVLQPDSYVTLSLFWPPADEAAGMNFGEGSYKLLNRRGWIGSTDGMNLRRPGVRMLAEGSVLTAQPQGALVDVKPSDPFPVLNVPHDVWRCGLAYAVGCRTATAEGGGV